MKRVVNVAEAKAKLPELIDAALRGEEVVIARRNKPLVRLTTVTAPHAKPLHGRFRGRIRVSPDFDAALEGFTEYER